MSNLANKVQDVAGVTQNLKRNCQTDMELVQNFGDDMVYDDDGIHARPTHNRKSKPLNRQPTYKENLSCNTRSIINAVIRIIHMATTYTLNNAT